MTTKRERILWAAAGCAAGVGMAAMLGATALAARTAPDPTSYAIGHDLGLATLARLDADGVTYDAASLMEGFDDAMAGREPAFQSSELDAALAVLQRDVAQRAAEARLTDDPVFAALAKNNQAESDAFVEAFAEAQETLQLEGGVLYQIEADGDGASPQAGDSVRLSFLARLRDGSLVGDERDFVVPIDGMIRGAQTAVRSMRVGDRWIVVIPSDLAFGLGGREPDIGPNQVIITEVELLGIEQ